MLPFPAGKRL